MKDVISVIVPVYNVAAYLPECLESILRQDYEHLEVLLIDDGATDDSGAICDQYAARDSRIRVIHQKNGGAGAAKNTGLRHATGEYLTFLDSDDYLEPGAYRHMVNLMERYDADVVRCSFRNVFRFRSEENVYESGTTVETGKAFLQRFLGDWTCGLLWNKLYKRTLFDGIFFPVGRKIDDDFFTYQGILNAAKVVCDDRVVYNYRKRASGVMLSPQSLRQLSFDRVDFMDQRRRNVAARFPELKRQFDLAYVDALSYLSDQSENTPEGIRYLRRHSIDYFLERGNTFPPKHLLRGLLRLHFTKTEKLLEEGRKNRAQVDPGEYFA